MSARGRTRVAGVAFGGLAVVLAAAAAPTGAAAATGPRVVQPVTAINDHRDTLGGGDVDQLPPYLRRGNGRIEQLPLPAGVRAADARLLNDHGTIAGSYYASGFHTIVWTGPEHHMSVVDLPGASNAAVRDVDERGRVLISDVSRSPTGPGYVWAAGTLTPVASLTRGEHTDALAIDDRGELAGNDPGTSWRWDGQRTVTLAPLPGDRSTIVFAMNSFGVTTGLSGDHAVVWDRSGRPRALPDLARPADADPAAQGHGVGYAINDRGDVAGTESPAWLDYVQAVVWPHDSAPIDLGIGFGTGINVRGDVTTGERSTAPGYWTAAETYRLGHPRAS